MYKLRWILPALLALGLAAIFMLYRMNPDNLGYLLSRRLPVLAAIALGAWAVGSSALSFQTIANNDIITPGVMGMEGLFILAHTMLIVFAPQLQGMDPLIPFAFALLVLLLYSLVLLRQLKWAEAGINILLLTGIVASTLFTSTNAFFQKVMDPNEFSILQASTMGSVNNVNPRILVAGSGIAVICSIFLYMARKELDVLALGRDTAMSLGIHYKRRVGVIVMSSLGLTAISTAVIGPFPFLGLVIASLTRSWYQDYRHSRLFPAAFLAGFIVILGGYLIVERLLKNQLTLPNFLNLAGGIVFLFLLSRRSKHASG